MPIDTKALQNLLYSLNTSQSSIKEKFGELIRIFYLVVNELTNDDWVSFKNFYARYKFFLNQYLTEPSQRKELDAFRKFIRYEARTSEDEIALEKAIFILDWMTHLISDSKKPLNAPNFFSLKTTPNKNLKDLIVVVNEVITGVHPIIRCNNIEELDQPIEIKIQNPNLAYLETILKKNLLVGFLNLEIVHKELLATAQSLAIVEPDFLMDATAVSECFSFQGENSNIYFLKKLTKSLSNDKAFKGVIVGQILDELVRNPENFKLEETLKEEITKNPINALRLGQPTLDAIKESIASNHLDYIKKLALEQHSKKVWIEPTYFSTIYGLQGRIDLLNEKEGEKGKNIIELKSGTPSNPNTNIAWENHKIQSVCYDMVLESTYPEAIENTVAVFYSNKVPTNTSPYRFIVSEYNEKSKTLKIRNEIVCKILAIAQEDYLPFQDLLAANLANQLPPFLVDSHNELRQYLSTNSISRVYYFNLLSFVLRELIIAKIGTGKGEEEGKNESGFAALWLDNIEAKKENFKIIYDLKIDSIDFNSAQICCVFPDLPHSFRAGDLVILYPKTQKGYNALRNQILKGSIQSIEKNQIKISLFNKQMDYSYLNHYESWAIEPDIYENNYWNVCSGLLNVLKSSEHKRKILLGHKQPQFLSSPYIEIESLNNNQNEVLHQALTAKDYYLLQGPPGTGKTSMFLLNFIRKSIVQPHSPTIVVLAFTNKAVEKIVETFNAPRFGAPLKFTRFGNKNLKDSNNFIEKIKNKPFPSWEKSLVENKVFVTTVSSFHNNWMEWRTFISFDILVVDEASQLTEADLAGIVVLFKKFILIGDHKQLPAVVTQSESSSVVNNSHLNDLGIWNWRTSLFERLLVNAKNKNWLNAFGQLTHHFRMHQEIAHLIRKHYQKPLIPGTPQQILSALKNRVEWIQIFTEGSLKKNVAEAQSVVLKLKSLVNEDGYQPNEIGIITPFKAQITTLKSLIPEEWIDKITIDTVERYQGDERKVILFSSTISSAFQVASIQSIAKMDPLQTDRKLLVCISRAIERFYLFGNPNALQFAPAYAELLANLAAD